MAAAVEWGGDSGEDKKIEGSMLKLDISHVQG
jgi:hypothetical protein